ANGQPVRLYGTARDVTEAHDAEMRRQLLAAAATVLGESLDYTTTLQRVVALAASSFADWCSIFFRTEDGKTRRIEAVYDDPRKAELAKALEQLPHNLEATVGVAEVFRTGRTELYTRIPEGFWERISADPSHVALRQKLGIRSLIFVPVRARGRTLGVLSFATAESGREYSSDDL